eukprot:539080-Amorphochlora_amoeboformis.AAC.2
MPGYKQLPRLIREGQGVPARKSTWMESSAFVMGVALDLEYQRVSRAYRGVGVILLERHRSVHTIPTPRF